MKKGHGQDVIGGRAKSARLDVRATAPVSARVQGVLPHVIALLAAVATSETNVVRVVATRVAT
ncbi:MAG: hypothetical protein Q4A07_07915 [Coriobacteriales bacterium]|nr:hypothetical protein [Coriobacteriales bacterium]